MHYHIVYLLEIATSEITEGIVDIGVWQTEGDAKTHADADECPSGYVACIVSCIAPWCAVPGRYIARSRTS